MTIILRKSARADNARQNATLLRLELAQEEILHELKAQTLALAIGADKTPDYLRRNA